MSVILDGRARFDCSLAEFYQRPEIVQAVARQGVMMPLPSDVEADAPPALAFVNSLSPLEDIARWLALCPDCSVGAAYVWLDQPIMFCLHCANRTIGHTWRPVLVPVERVAIERLLLARPDPAHRHWTPDESLDELRAQNVALGV